MCLAIPGRLVAVIGDGELRVGEVDFGGISRDANLAFVPEAVVGDYVLVHVGFAISVIDEDVARDTLEALTMFEALTDDERPNPGDAGNENRDLSGISAAGSGQRSDGNPEPGAVANGKRYLTPISGRGGR